MIFCKHNCDRTINARSRITYVPCLYRTKKPVLRVLLTIRPWSTCHFFVHIHHHITNQTSYKYEPEPYKLQVRLRCQRLGSRHCTVPFVHQHRPWRRLNGARRTPWEGDVVWCQEIQKGGYCRTVELGLICRKETERSFTAVVHEVAMDTHSQKTIT